MQTKFKRKQKVRLLRNPDPEYIEYHTENSDDQQTPITKGMLGRINILLPNGQYHVEILDENGKELAYAPMAEEDLELTEDAENSKDTESADDTEHIENSESQENYNSPEDTESDEDQD